mgnify:FL=1
MTKKEPVTPAFGAFLSKCQKEQLVNGRHLTNETIAQATMMSTRTYNLLKRAEQQHQPDTCHNAFLEVVPENRPRKGEF